MSSPLLSLHTDWSFNQEHLSSHICFMNLLIIKASVWIPLSPESSALIPAVKLGLDVASSRSSMPLRMLGLLCHYRVTLVTGSGRNWVPGRAEIMSASLIKLIIVPSAPSKVPGQEQTLNKCPCFKTHVILFLDAAQGLFSILYLLNYLFLGAAQQLWWKYPIAMSANRVTTSHMLLLSIWNVASATGRFLLT